MPDWLDIPAYYPPGTAVYFFRARKGKPGPRERGTLLTGYITGSLENEHPAIRSEKGGIIYGCECWWIPVEVADKIEAEANHA